MNNAIYPWQAAAWQQLQVMRERLPHAILFHGEAGTGKADFIEAFAQSLLCENVQADGFACGACASCGWFSQHNHPDYRRVRPEALEDEPPADGEEGADADGGKKSKSTKAPSKEIKIEQIRQLADFMNISTHRQGLRVVVLYPAEALNTPASNALLKTLEEPPPGTVFLLASNSLDRLLPTILSRCRKFALPMPDNAQAVSWLKEQGLADADSWLREQGGAPLAQPAVGIGQPLLLEPAYGLGVVRHRQCELAATRQDGGQQPVQAVRRQQEHGARRRLFQRFQQGVRGRRVERFGRVQDHHPQPLAM